MLLFHDHEWEQAILEWALATPAFYIGAITHSREPGVLALSVLAEIVGAYEALHPHG